MEVVEREAVAPPPPGGQGVRGFVRKVLSIQEMTVLIPFVIILFLFFLRNPAAMLAPLTITSIFRTIAFPGIIGMGMVLLMIAGEIDLSTSAVMSLTAVFAAVLIRDVGLPVPLAVVCSLVVSVIVGLVNGLIVLRFGVHAVLTTLGVGFAVRGISYLFSNGLPIYPLPDEVGFLGSLKLTQIPVLGALPKGFSFSVAFLVLIFLMIVVQVVLNWTPWGAKVFATGANKLAAEIAGIKTNRVKLACFVLTSFLAGVSGLLYMSQLPAPAGDPIIGKNLELDIIAGVILGGVSFFGGRGSAIGTLFGVMLMQVVRTGMVIAHLDPYLQTPALGALMVIAASADVIRHRRREG